MSETQDKPGVILHNSIRYAVKRVVSMPQREVRIRHEMDSLYKGEYELVPAIQNIERPWKGLSDTIKQIVQDNYEQPFIHIFEDDVLFTSKKSREVFESNFDLLPDDWQIYLGGAYTFPELYSTKMIGLIKMQRFSSLHCAVIRKSVYDLILSHDATDKRSFHLDYFLSENKVNTYLCDPTIAIQYPGYSFLAKRSVSYENFEKRMNILR